MDYISVLSDLGYQLTDDGAYWRTCAIYRGGDNRTALRICKRTGKWKDFVTDASGSFEDLVKMTDSNYKAKEMLGERVEPIRIKQKPEKIYPKTILGKLVPHYSYLNRRGISDETAKIFDAGLAHSGKLYRRILFPIYNLENTHIIGFTGRYNSENVPENTPKYKHEGKKLNWVWPAHLAKEHIDKERSVYLVESPMCVLALWQCGIKNVLCTFGLIVSSKLLSFLIACCPKKIYICLNNEDSQRGNLAAEKIKKKLTRFFNEEQVIIKLPVEKDICAMLEKDREGDTIREWIKNGTEN